MLEKLEGADEYLQIEANVEKAPAKHPWISLSYSQQAPLSIRLSWPTIQVFLFSCLALFVDHIKQLENPIGCLECRPYRRSTNIAIDAKLAKAPLTRRVAYSFSLMCIFTRLAAITSAHCLLTCISEMQTTWFTSLASECGSFCLSTHILLFLDLLSCPFSFAICNLEDWQQVTNQSSNHPGAINQ